MTAGRWPSERVRMTQPQERLPNRKNEINALGSRLKVTLKQARDGSAEVDIIGNRAGLRALAAICAGLSELTNEQLLTPANHCHLDEWFWRTETGSVPLTVYCLEADWPASENETCRILTEPYEDATP
jgi:hypothetical protein